MKMFICSLLGLMAINIVAPAPTLSDEVTIAYAQGNKYTISQKITNPVPVAGTVIPVEYTSVWQDDEGVQIDVPVANTINVVIPSINWKKTNTYVFGPSFVLQSGSFVGNGGINTVNVNTGTYEIWTVVPNDGVEHISSWTMKFKM